MNLDSIYDLKIEDISLGYVYNSKKQDFTCIFCGETFDEGIVYEDNHNFITAKRAIEQHIEREHKGVLKTLLSLEKDITGLTEIQSKVITGLMEKKESKKLAEEMGISPSTVRTHKFYLQKLKRQSKIFLTIMNLLELQEEEVESKELLKNEKLNEELLKNSCETNSLHPFFTQYNLK